MRSPSLFPILALTVGAALCAGCETRETGALRAALLFPRSGTIRRAQVPAGVPEEVDRLIISALDVGGSTLAQTILSVAPAEGEEELHREGGVWTLDRVPVGNDRRVRAQAFFGAVQDARYAGELALQGERKEIEVRPGVTTDVGPILLSPAPGARLPSLDFESPGAPAPLEARAVSSGEALDISWARPADPDVAGYVLAIGTELDETAEIGRGTAAPDEGALLAGSFRVLAVVEDPEPGSVMASGLEDGLPYAVLAFAYDSDFAGAPLNFSGAAKILAIPRDTDPPGPASGFTAEVHTSTSVLIRFTAGGEDGDEGLPSRYELRAAESEGELLDSNRFAQLAPLPVPEVRPPGSSVSFVLPVEPTGFDATSPFLLGLRAVDRAGNPGPIRTAYYPGESGSGPRVRELWPEIGLVGSSVELRGNRFGMLGGRVELFPEATTSTAALLLEARSWDDERIVLGALPPEAGSGRLRVVRSDGAAAESYLSILERSAASTPSLTPFVAVGAPLADGGQDSALYASLDNGGLYEHFIVRDTPSPDRILSRLYPQPTTAVAGSYSPSSDTFLFIASTSDSSAMSSAIFSPRGSAGASRRIDNAVRTGNADSISVEILEPSAGGGLAALLAFSSNGVVRTATVADASIQPFQGFVVVTPSAEIADRVRIRRHALSAQPGSSPILMAYRAGGPETGELMIRDAQGNGGAIGAFVPRVTSNRPPVGERIEILDVPGLGFVVAYEERLEDRTEIRLLPEQAYGSTAGYAPFTDDGRGRSLEDVGLVTRDGRAWIAVAATARIGGLEELSYTEVDPDEITQGGRGTHRGIPLDLSEGSARLSCQPLESRVCRLFWLGPDIPQTLYERR